MKVIVGICTMYWERVMLVNNIELQVISNGYVKFIRQVHDPSWCLTADRPAVWGVAFHFPALFRMSWSFSQVRRSTWGFVGWSKQKPSHKPSWPASRWVWCFHIIDSCWSQSWSFQPSQSLCSMIDSKLYDGIRYYNYDGTIVYVGIYYKCVQRRCQVDHLSLQTVPNCEMARLCG